MKSLNDIVQGALAKLGENPSLEDLEKAAALLKTQADIEKLQTEIDNSSASSWQEGLKAWSVILVPLSSLIALVLTVGIQALQLQASREQQSLQLQASRQQDEDTQWRAFLDSVREETKNSSGQITSDLTFPSRLKSFVSSKVYGSQAIELARRTLGIVVNQAAFDELFHTVFGDYHGAGLPDLVDISRVLKRGSDDNYVSCGTLSQNLSSGKLVSGNFCAVVNDDDAKEILDSNKDKKNNQELLTRRQSSSVLVGEMQEVSNLIVKRLLESGASTDMDLDGAMITLAKLPGFDFSRVSVSGTIFDRVDLYQSKLVPKKFENMAAWGSNWWDAAEIDQDLLQTMLANSYPGYFAGEIIVGHQHEVNRQYYVQQINQLCTSKAEACLDANLKFIPANFTVIYAGKDF